jgi:hypothetical protein
LDIAYYLELQRRLVESFRFVSCHELNFNTYSIVLESLLIDIGSFFDSLCQTYLRDSYSTGHKFKAQSRITDFDKKASSNANFNFGDYRTLLEAEFTMSARQVNLNQYEDAF